MTKIEIINEMYDVINNNADVFNYAEKHMTKYYADKVKTTKKATLEQWLAKLNAMVEEVKKVETIETEVENNTEKNVEDMTKNEIIAEIKNVVNANGGRYSKSCDYMKKAELVAYLNDMKYYASLKAEKVETVDVENDTEYVAETKATKKDIIMGLHKNNEVKCDLATAEALATEGFIIIDRYEDGVLYGAIFWDSVDEEVMNEDELLVYNMAHSGLENWGEGYKIMKELYSKGYLVDFVEDEERCYANQNPDKVLSDFCKRWDNKLNAAA